MRIRTRSSRNRELLQNATVKLSIHRPRYGPFTLDTQEEILAPNPTGREEFVVKNPATGENITSIYMSNERDARTAIYHANEIFKSGEWSKAPAQMRAGILSNLARSLEERIDEFAQLESMQTGRAIREMKAQMSRLPEWLDYYAGLLRTRQDFIAPTHGKLLNYVQRVPLGVVAQITVSSQCTLRDDDDVIENLQPFNHPLLIALKKIVPALAAGNSVIVKPSELAPISVLEFAEMVVAEGVPPGVLSVLPGYGRTIAKTLASDPFVRKVDITAGTSTGRTLGGIVGSNLASFTAELGGKAPIVVFNDADPISAANGAAFACFVASGQTCVSGTRLIVQDKIYDEFMRLFMQKVHIIRAGMGNPLNPACTMGPIISSRQLEHIENMVQRPGVGKILAGGQRLTGKSALDDFNFSKGSFFPPTVIADVATEDDLWREEIFGPVVVVKRFEASSLLPFNALDTDTRAAIARIWTRDVSRAHQVASEIEAGIVWVNTHHRNDPSSPWGGMKESGIGRENGIEALEAYSQSKSTIVNIASVEETRQAQDWFAEDDNTLEKRYG
ncbi:aldehyde dehydrogenase [Obba rivulosa]|uniref:Aldehyde dehydrogenase n=1 Tax=Obba rivulosa TaxID=1052685 RepID=A0A8E2DMG7_9APHY|nr:aldehyde dehydrogenase [Obba rivulosa]